MENKKKIYLKTAHGIFIEGDSQPLIPGDETLHSRHQLFVLIFCLELRMFEKFNNEFFYYKQVSKSLLSKV